MKAKDETFLTVEPPPDICTGNLWTSFVHKIRNDPIALEVQDELTRLQSPVSDDHDSLDSISVASRDDVHHVPLPDKWVDFFCIVGPQPVSGTGASAKYSLVYSSKNKDGGELTPKLLDCYPKSREYTDFPKHLPTFCFPNGCRPLRIRLDDPSTSNSPDPTIYSSVLTSSTGHRLYSSILTVYYEAELDGVSLPSNSKANRNFMSAPDPPTTTENAEYRYLIPKCLVLISHYPFFSAQSTILKELLITVQSGVSPIPFERYVAHIVDDIPLPPLGKVRIEWESWIGQLVVPIERPAPNQLPLLNVSFGPLLRTLSVSNLMVLWATLLQEGRVILCCSPENVALLTPVAESLLSLLFPLQWQGMYIPVLPSHMKDVLEAPVPYLVGISVIPDAIIHPLGVVICDLDEDVLHMGWNEDGYVQETLPHLPEHASLKLKLEMEELADPLYLPVPCGVKGRMTAGDKNWELDNGTRHPYAQMTRLPSQPTPRSYILSHACKVSPEMYYQQLPKPKLGNGFRLSNKYRPQEVVRDSSQVSTGKPTMMHDNPDLLKSIQRQGRSLQAHADRFLAMVVGQSYASHSPYVSTNNLADMIHKKDEIAAKFFDLDRSLSDRVRWSFLRFFLSLFSKYSLFLRTTTHHGKARQGLDMDGFLQSLKLPPPNQEYVAKILQSQMFDRFLQHETSSLRYFFDGHIWQRQNQNKSGNCSNNSKNNNSLFGNLLPLPSSTKILSTKDEKAILAFLNSKKWKVKKVLIPSPPSRVGISKYHHQEVHYYCQDGRFPDTLDPKECVTSKTVRQPWYDFCYGALCWPFLATDSDGW